MYLEVGADIVKSAVTSIFSLALGFVLSTGLAAAQVAGLNSTSGLCAVGADTGKTYASYNPTTPLAPASIQKLLVSAAALESLGALYSPITEVSVGGRIVGNKTPKLFIKAGLDPGFTTERAFLLGRMIRSFGITKIGELVLDDTALLDGRERAGSRAFLSGISAFGLNWNAYTVRACAGSGRVNPGPPSVIVDPFEFQLPVVGKIRLGEGTSISISEGSGSVTASGIVERGGCGEEYASAEDIRRYTASVLKGVIRAAGVESEAVGWGKVPSDAERLFTFPARPLEELLKDMNYFSNNNMAEMFVALLGAGSDGRFSRRLGLERVREFVSGVVGGSVPGLNLEDGSGLSPANKVSADVFCAILQAEYKNPDSRITFFGALPQFGVSGTMKKRLSGVSGRAKTGSLSNVSSLAGVVYGRTEPILFVLIQNQLGDTAKAKVVEERIVAT